jgi:hypothetical protein
MLSLSFAVELSCATSHTGLLADNKGEVVRSKAICRYFSI